MSKDWTHLLEKYRGKWVALGEDETTVLAFGNSAKEVHSAAVEKFATPFLYRVPDALETFVGHEVRV
jgi:hypothetical protein